MKKLKLEGILEIEGELKKVSFDGFAEFEEINFTFICGFCGNHDTRNASCEVNFREKKIYYMCKECKKINELALEKNNLGPLPRTRIM